MASARLYKQRTWHLERTLRVIFWLITIVLGGCQTWANRHAMNPDGISYLNLADACTQGDWNRLINGYWNPLYPCLLRVSKLLLGPPPHLEFAVAHLAHFWTYLFAFFCYDLLLSQLIRHQDVERAGSFEGRMRIPAWGMLALGYLLFLWSSLHLITISLITPDYLVAASVYLASAVLLRIQRGKAPHRLFAGLGVILGFGYLAKAIMFPLAFVFLAVGLLAIGNWRHAWRPTLIALLAFLAVSGPYVLALSASKGRFTFGDSGKLSYSWFLNGTSRYFHWQGEVPGNGTPLHPTRKISDAPVVYEFAGPIKGTYPPWQDPSYWHEGLKAYFDMKSQVRVVFESLKFYFALYFYSYGLVFSCGLLVLCGVMVKNRILDIRYLFDGWALLIPAFAALGLYSLVHASNRLVATFAAILYLGLFSGLRLVHSAGSEKLIQCVVFMMMATIGGMLMAGEKPALASVANDLMNREGSQMFEQWKLAESLNLMGVRPGDRIAVIGDGFDAYYARLAGLQVAAEIPRGEAGKFWESDANTQTKILDMLARNGIKCIVTERVPAMTPTNDWKRLGETMWHARLIGAI